MDEKIFTNAEIVLADRTVRGTLVVRDGRIAAIDEGTSRLEAGVDFGGDLLIPGMVELHTDNLERHMMPRPSSRWPVDAALMSHDREIVAAGITTVFNAIYVGERHSHARSIDVLTEIADGMGKQVSAGALKADHMLHLRCEISHSAMADELDLVIDNPFVRMISVMDHTPGQRQFVNLESYITYYQGKFGMNDDELAKFMAKRKADQELYSEGNRRAAIARARERGLPVASHDDTTVGHVEEAIADGISIAEFPTTIEAARASHEAGLAVLMGGPNVVRGKSHSGNVSARELAELGYLDVLSSDYVPASLLYATLLLHGGEANIGLPEAVAMVTRTPARELGLDDRGEISVGLNADLVRVTPTSGAPIIRNVWRMGEKIA